jgi:hypothetical protein
LSFMQLRGLSKAICSQKSFDIFCSDGFTQRHERRNLIFVNFNMYLIGKENEKNICGCSGILRREPLSSGGIFRL